MQHFLNDTEKYTHFIQITVTVSHLFILVFNGNCKNMIKSYITSYSINVL